MRRASSSSADEAFFSTKARAPLRMALTTEFSSSYMERITIFTPGQWRSNSVVASMPFMPGNPISISTRSGAVDDRHLDLLDRDGVALADLQHARRLAWRRTEPSGTRGSCWSHAAARSHRASDRG